MAKYKNPFYNKNYQNSTPVIETDAKPIQYSGCLIYERIKGVCFDVVKDGVCLTMRAGLNGAKRAIDEKKF